ncbi:uncharacterized protein LOC116189043 [Punica granatum]|uniref:Uncharacterized protein n=2 Tax=Punica granatum TaxID=22663 RepID=A0A218XGN8_PUNGR|nr:uncharacterized protein LOC116189043 [Punica granatum]OWM84093.1 hypothetical protein CDL15_Pgr009340 [Punica granatum]PKI39736.1 hypothetical protein CRG98_039873 [Punica granatum]
MSMTETYLAEIKSKVGMTPYLEENSKTKELHITGVLSNREFPVITYNHNVFGDVLMKENRELKKKIEDLEKLMKQLLMFPPSMYPNLMNNPMVSLLSNPLLRSVDLEDHKSFTGQA